MLPIEHFITYTCTPMSSPNPTSVEEGKVTMNSDPSGVSNDRRPRRKRRERSDPGIKPRSLAPPPSKRWTKSLVTHLQAENEKLKYALRVAQRIRKEDKLAPTETSSEEENGGGAVGINDNDSALGGGDAGDRQQL
jgi:hypothetical protein